MFQIVKLLSAVMLMLVSGPQSQLPASETLLVDDNLSPQGQQWVDSVYASLTPEQRVAQLFVPHLVISYN